MIKILIYRINYLFLKIKYRKNKKFVVKNRIVPTNVIINADKESVLYIESFDINIKKTTINLRENSTLNIGKNFNCFSDCLITIRSNISIGNDVKLFFNVKVYDHDHAFRETTWRDHYYYGNVVIGNNVMIGSNCVILRNTTIKENTIIIPGQTIKGSV